MRATRRANSALSVCVSGGVIVSRLVPLGGLSHNAPIATTARVSVTAAPATAVNRAGAERCSCEVASIIPALARVTHTVSGYAHCLTDTLRSAYWMQTSYFLRVALLAFPV